MHYLPERLNPVIERSAAGHPSPNVPQDNGWPVVHTRQNRHDWLDQMGIAKEDGAMQLDAATWQSRKGGLEFDMFVPTGSAAANQAPAHLSWNVRAVGFIAKPEKAQELATSVEGRIAGLLRQSQGFSGTIVLQSQIEGRSLLVLTFWETEKQAATNCWEEFTAVKEIIAPAVDVCTKVQIFRASVSPLLQSATNREPTGLC